MLLMWTLICNQEWVIKVQVWTESYQLLMWLSVSVKGWKHIHLWHHHRDQAITRQVIRGDYSPHLQALAQLRNFTLIQHTHIQTHITTEEKDNKKKACIPLVRDLCVLQVKTIKLLDRL